MTEDELDEAVAALRQFRNDTATIEAKACSQDKLPKAVPFSLSAFSNTSGGVVILGLDESSGFSACGVADAKKIASDLASAAQNVMDPPLSPTIEHHLFEGVNIVTAEVKELPRAQKPSFYKPAGMNNGSYKRVADGDYKMSAYEVSLMVASRGQPRDDEDPVPDAKAPDLDESLVNLYLENLRRTRPNVYTRMKPAEALISTRVLVADGNRIVPSLAGLLAFGHHPQRFFPQLKVTFVSYPTDEGPSSVERFLDNVTIEGNVPAMLIEATGALRRNMQRRAIVKGLGREDVFDYPDAALREVIVNALVHRDLSAASRGMPVQIEMYPNRLEIRNPGGLYGPVRIEELGESGISSSRNSTLLNILQDVPTGPEGRTICENRGSGIRVMVAALRDAYMGVPQFRDRISSFEVTFPKHSLFSEDTVAWIKALDQDGLTPNQHIALALLRQDSTIDNPAFRKAAGIDSRQATADLQDLVARELIVQNGVARWATYSLSTPAQGLVPVVGTGAVRLRPADRRNEILRALETDTLSRREIQARSGLNAKVVASWLRTLIKEGRVARTAGPAQSNATRYWATNPEFRIGQQSLWTTADPPDEAALDVDSSP